MQDKSSLSSNSIQSSPKKKSGPAAEIRLLGQRIALRCGDEDPEVVDQVVQLVSTRIRNAELRGKNAAAHQVVLLALLDLAEEYVRAKQRTVEYKQDLEARAQSLLGLVGKAGAGE